MNKILTPLTLLFPFTLVSCSMDPAEMNRRGAANQAKAKQNYQNYLAKKQGRAPSTYGPQKYGESLDATRERARIENNKIANKTTNPFIRHQDR